MPVKIIAFAIAWLGVLSVYSTSQIKISHSVYKHSHHVLKIIPCYIIRLYIYSPLVKSKRRRDFRPSFSRLFKVTEGRTLQTVSSSYYTVYWIDQKWLWLARVSWRKSVQPLTLIQWEKWLRRRTSAQSANSPPIRSCVFPSVRASRRVIKYSQVSQEDKQGYQDQKLTLDFFVNSFTTSSANVSTYFVL